MNASKRRELSNNTKPEFRRREHLSVVKQTVLYHVEGDDNEKAVNFEASRSHLTNCIHVFRSDLPKPHYEEGPANNSRWRSVSVSNHDPIAYYPDGQCRVHAVHASVFT